MKGKVNARNEATVQFAIQSRNVRQIITAVIDTGYNGIITLPPSMIQSLRLRRVGETDAELADGSSILFGVFSAVLEWDGRRRTVLIHEANTFPLVGMELLRGYELNICIRPRGAVTITRLK